MDALAAAIKSAVREVIEEQRDVLARGALPRLISFNQAAEYLGISDRYLRALVSEGVFCVVRHKQDGNKYLDRYDLDAYINQKKQGAAA